MRLRIAFAALLLTVLQAGYSQTMMEKADKEYELFAFNRAVKTYLNAINNEGYTAESLARLADCYRNLNQMSEAAKWYEKATKTNGISPEQLFNYGQVLTALGKYDEALQWFTVYAGTHSVKGNHFVENTRFAKNRVGDPTSYNVSNLQTNTKTSDFAPTFYGDKLVFASSRTDIKKDKSAKNWTGNAQNRLFTASADRSGQLSVVQLLHADLRNAFNEGPLTFSPDGKTVLFTKNNFTAGTRQIPTGGAQMSIFIADVENDDWTASKPFVHNTVNSNTGYPSFSPDGKALYFASDRPGGFGGYDIYVCYRYENTWSAPENLGATVNSPGNEISPFFDGTELYFSSDWHPGFGGYDIFRAEKSNLNWNRVYHLGTGVNTGYDDYGFIYNKKSNQGYLTSNRLRGKGAEDIYSVKLISNQIVISVTNGSTGEAVEGAIVNLTNCGLSEVKTDKTGKIKLETIDGIDCLIEIEKENFLKESIRMNTFSGQKNFQVTLKNPNDMYRGQVFDSNNSQPVADVTVKATNRSSGIVTTVLTDANGEYSLAFAGGNNYNLKYSKVGFLEINQIVRTGDGSDKNILKPVKLTPLGAIAEEATSLTSKSLPAPPPPVPAKSVEIAETEVKTKVEFPADPTPVDIAPSTGEFTATAGEGFSIQLFSLKTDDTSVLDDLKAKYSGIGDVYTKKVDGSIKVRVGVYADRTTAKDAQLQLRAKGVENSFIVPDIHPLKLKEKENASAPAKKSASKMTAKSTGKEYKVRLAAYKNTKWFEESKVSEIGNIERIKSGDMTVIVLSGFANKWEAKKGMKQAQDAGFKEAYVFNYENGVMKRVE